MRAHVLIEQTFEYGKFVDKIYKVWFFSHVDFNSKKKIILFFMIVSNHMDVMIFNNIMCPCVMCIQ